MASEREPPGRRADAEPALPDTDEEREARATGWPGKRTFTDRLSARLSAQGFGDRPSIRRRFMQRAAARSGRPLPEAFRRRLERSLDRDLGDVRLHTGHEAADAAHVLAARAYTSGREIFFADGAYDPDSSRGQHLLAHEVAHTVQHAGASGFDRTRVSEPGDASEVEADRFADAFLYSADRAPAVRPLGGIAAVSRSPDPDVEREQERDATKEFVDRLSGRGLPPELARSVADAMAGLGVNLVPAAARTTVEQVAVEVAAQARDPGPAQQGGAAQDPDRTPNVQGAPATYTAPAMERKTALPLRVDHAAYEFNKNSRGTIGGVFAPELDEKWYAEQTKLAAEYGVDPYFWIAFSLEEYGGYRVGQDHAGEIDPSRAAGTIATGRGFVQENGASGVLIGDALNNSRILQEPQIQAQLKALGAPIESHELPPDDEEVDLYVFGDSATQEQRDRQSFILLKRIQNIAIESSQRTHKWRTPPGGRPRLSSEPREGKPDIEHGLQSVHGYGQIPYLYEAGKFGPDKRVRYDMASGDLGPLDIMRNAGFRGSDHPVYGASIAHFIRQLAEDPRIQRLVPPNARTPVTDMVHAHAPVRANQSGKEMARKPSHEVVYEAWVGHTHEETEPRSPEPEPGAPKIVQAFFRRGVAIAGTASPMVLAVTVWRGDAKLDHLEFAIPHYGSYRLDLPPGVGNNDEIRMETPVLLQLQKMTVADAHEQDLQLVAHDAKGRTSWYELKLPIKPPAEPGASVQFRGRDGGAGGNPFELARRGLAGGGGALPFAGAIQRGFGRHQVGDIRAHSGEDARAANEQMGSLAFAYGMDVAFRGTPDLFTAAHEAAHVIQQRAGLRPAGGVGQVGDEYERQADAVAERVVRGESAEGLLDTIAPGHRPDGATGEAVQFQMPQQALRVSDPEQLEKIAPSLQIVGAKAGLTVAEETSYPDAKSPTLRIPRGSRLTLTLTQQRLTFDCSGDGIWCDVPGPLNIWLKQIYYEFATRKVGAVSGGLLSSLGGGVTNHFVVAECEKLIRPALPAAMKKPNYTPGGDPDVVATIQQLQRGFGVEVNLKDGQHESPLSVADPRLDLEMSLRRELRLQLFGDRVEVLFTQGLPVNVQLAMTDAKAGETPALRSLSLTARAPLRALHGPPLDALLRGVVVRPGCKVEFDLATNPTGQHGAVMAELHACVTRPLIDLLRENEADVPLLRDFLQAPRAGQTATPRRTGDIDLAPVGR